MEPIIVVTSRRTRPFGTDHCCHFQKDQALWNRSLLSLTEGPGPLEPIIVVTSRRTRPFRTNQCCHLQKDQALWNRSLLSLTEGPGPLEPIIVVTYRRTRPFRTDHCCHLQKDQARQDQYFDVLEQKEKMEDKMSSVREMKCRVVSCKQVTFCAVIAACLNASQISRISFQMVPGANVKAVLCDIIYCNKTENTSNNFDKINITQMKLMQLK